MAVPVKASTLADVLATAKAQADAYNKLSPEEREAQDKKTAGLLKELGPNGPAVFFIR